MLLWGRILSELTRQVLGNKIGQIKCAWVWVALPNQICPICVSILSQIVHTIEFFQGSQFCQENLCTYHFCLCKFYSGLGHSLLQHSSLPLVLSTWISHANRAIATALIVWVNWQPIYGNLCVTMILFLSIHRIVISVRNLFSFVFSGTKAQFCCHHCHKP